MSTHLSPWFWTSRLATSSRWASAHPWTDCMLFSGHQGHQHREAITEGLRLGCLPTPTNEVIFSLKKQPFINQLFLSRKELLAIFLQLIIFVVLFLLWASTSLVIFKNCGKIDSSTLFFFLIIRNIKLLPFQNWNPCQWKNLCCDSHYNKSWGA